jgi:predicted membrane protein
LASDAADALYRLTYETTVPEAVDVAWRLAYRTQAFRKQLRNNVIYAAVGAAVVFFAAWMYIVGTSPLNIVLAVVAATLFAIVFAATFRSILEKEIRKQQRQLIVEQFGIKTAIQCELELRSDGVWVRQDGMEMMFPWARCTGIQNNPGDIQMDFTPGICVLRNRHFASPAERQTFFDTARRLSEQTRPTASQ